MGNSKEYSLKAAADWQLLYFNVDQRPYGFSLLLSTQNKGTRSSGSQHEKETSWPPNLEDGLWCDNWKHEKRCRMSNTLKKVATRESYVSSQSHLLLSAWLCNVATNKYFRRSSMNKIHACITFVFSSNRDFLMRKQMV